MKHLYKLAFILVLGAGLSVAQTGATGQNPPTTPPTFPSGQQQPGTQSNPDQSPMGQTGTSSTTAITKAQSDIQTALRKQLPASADSVTVSVSDDNRIQLNGSVSSDTEKQQIEQIARSAAPDQTIVNKITVTGSSAMPPSGSMSGQGSNSAQDKDNSQNNPSNPSHSPDANSGPDRERKQATPPPMAMSFVQSGTQDKGGNMGQNQGSSSTPGQNTPTPSTTESSHYPTDNTETPNSKSGRANDAAAAAGSTEVQSNIQKAFQQDASLANANINVNVNGDNKVELTGTVADKEMKKTAKKIAEQNAAGYKVVDHIKVEHSKDNNSQSNPPKY